MPAGSIHWLGGPGPYSWQGFFSTKFVDNPRLDTVMLTMSTPGFDGALPPSAGYVAAATAAVVGDDSDRGSFRRRHADALTARRRVVRRPRRRGLG